MAINFKQITPGVKIVPKTSSTVDSAGDMDVDSTSNKINYHNGTSSSPIVTEVHASQGANRLKNKDLEDSTTAIVDASDTTKKIKFDASGTTGTSTTLLSSQTSNRILTLPDATDTLVGKATTDTLTNKIISGNTASNLINGSGTFNFNSSGTITTPNATDTLVGKATTDTLTNKTLNGNTASNLINGSGTFNFNSSGTLTAPNATDTLVGKATTDTLTNKTLSGNTASNLINGSGTINFNSTGTITVPNTTDTLVARTTTDTLTNKTLTTPNLDLPLIRDTSTSSKQVGFSISGATASTKTTLTFAQTANRIITFPDRAITVNLGTNIDSGAAASGQVLTADGSGGSAFASSSSSLVSPYDESNYSITATANSGTHALTISLKTQAGADPSGGDSVKISYRSSTSATGATVSRLVTAATSLVIPNLASLGLADNQSQPIYLYAIDNAGTTELAIGAFKLFDEGSVVSTTILNASSTTRSAIYSTTARSNVPCRLLARITSQQAVAGVWDTNPTEISLFPSNRGTTQISEIRLRQISGYGSVGTKISRWAAADLTNGTDMMEYTPDSTNGDYITIKAWGIYYFMYTDTVNSANANFGLSINASSLTTDIQSLPVGEIMAEVDMNSNGASLDIMPVTWMGRIGPGAIIRCHARGISRAGTNNDRTRFVAVRISD